MYPVTLLATVQHEFEHRGFFRFVIFPFHFIIMAFSLFPVISRPSGLFPPRVTPVIFSLLLPYSKNVEWFCCISSIINLAFKTLPRPAPLFLLSCFPDPSWQFHGSHFLSGDWLPYCVSHLEYSVPSVPSCLFFCFSDLFHWRCLFFLL